MAKRRPPSEGGMPAVQAPRLVAELLNADGHAEVFIHLDCVPGATSVALPNGTHLKVLGDDGGSYVVAHTGLKFGLKKRHCTTKVLRRASW